MRVLEQCEGYALPEQAMRDQLKLGMPALEDAALQEAIEWLNAKAYIDFTVEEITGTKRWVITESGKAKLK